MVSMKSWLGRESAYKQVTEQNKKACLAAESRLKSGQFSPILPAKLKCA
jgi:hypothetical protein